MASRRLPAGPGFAFAIAALLFLFAGPAEAQKVGRWSADINEASARFGIPEAWIRKVMAAESGGRTAISGRPITSRAGAMGLMQLMPATWAELRTSLDLGASPYEPHDNILAGTAYLRAMYDEFGYPGLFAAYNAGPAHYARFLAGGQPLPHETTAYLAAVTRRSVRSHDQSGSLLRAPETSARDKMEKQVSQLFVIHREEKGAGEGARPAPGIFAIRRECGSCPTN